MSSPFKHPKSGTYYLRKGVPKHLVPIIGKREFKQSLRTKDLREAKKRIIPLLADIDEQLDHAELTLKGEATQELSLRDCQIIANRWYVLTRDEVQKTDSYDDFLVFHNSENEHLVWDSADDKPRDASIYPHWFGLTDTLTLKGSEVFRASRLELAEFAEELSEFIDPQLKRDGISIPRSSDSYINLAKAFYSHIVDLQKLCLSRHKRNWSDEPRDMNLAHEALSRATNQNDLSNTVNDSETNLSNVYEQWRASDILQNKGNQSRLKTLDETKSKVARFVSIFGDMDIADITKSDIVKFRNTLLQLPKNKSRAVKKMTISEQIEFAAANELKLLSPLTVKNAIKQISPVFTYAVELGLVMNNPTFGVTVKNTEKQKEVDSTDRGYTPEDIATVFSDEVFTNPSFNHKYGLACYWVPLFCRYTGLRLGEIAQLDSSDIGRNEEGIYYLNIRRGVGQSVKTNSSLRHIPVPEHLIELGFLDYIAGIKGRLFPKVPKGSYDKVSIAMSRWWGNRVRAKGVETKQPSHAFRHTFKTEMRALGVQDSVSNSLSGHAAKSEGESYGSVTLKTKKDAIDKLPRLNIRKIY
jgi:integrase